jgi:hypothetical protein
MSYLVCPSCAQKALPVATRCPRCGLAFEGQRFPPTKKTPRRSRTAIGLLSAGVVVSVLGANALMQRLHLAPSPAPPGPAAEPPPRPELLPRPVVESLGATVVLVDTAAASTSQAPAEFQPPQPVSGDDPAQLSAPTEPVDLGAAQRRYASTWTNVRAGRSNAAQVLRILRPGEGVQVDLLERGWYRIRTETQTVGYVDRRLLSPSPALTTP